MASAVAYACVISLDEMARSDRRVSGSSRRARADAEHSFKSDMAEARETHRKLQKLLEDVKQGKLRTFGKFVSLSTNMQVCLQT
jgi:hypothetical protein